MSLPCAWCAEPSTTEVEAVPADINSRTKEVRKRAVVVPVCETHRELVFRETTRIELSKEIKKLRNRSLRGNLKEPTRKAILKELATRERALAALDAKDPA